MSNGRVRGEGVAYGEFAREVQLVIALLEGQDFGIELRFGIYRR